MPKNADLFKLFPKGPESVLASSLTVIELFNLAMASKHNYYRLFKPMLDVAQLLQHVVRGEQDAAQALLRRRPDLLIKKGRVTDYSGRTFHDVSAWQCMLWALDTRYMGQMMLSCVPSGEAGDVIRRELLKQFEAMQGGGRDIVKLAGTIDPQDIPFHEIEVLFCNDDALLFWNDRFFYVKRGDTSVTPLEACVSDEQAEPFARLIASLKNMRASSARKSMDEEHALIGATLGCTLSRKGIHYEMFDYEAPDRDTNLVKIDGAIAPGDRDFDELAHLFGNEDALLCWNDGFYYANKTVASVTPITPTLTTENAQAFAAFKALFTDIPSNSALQASPSEHVLIQSTLRPQGLSRKTMHYCDGHYDFGIIDTQQTYIELPNDSDSSQRDELWAKVSKAQWKMPANVLQHYCDPDIEFFPRPDFKAEDFTRYGLFFNRIVGKWSKLFSGSSLTAGLGFQFGLIRGDIGKGALVGSLQSVVARDLIALRELYKVRINDAKHLQDKLNQSLELACTDSSAAGRPTI